MKYVAPAHRHQWPSKKGFILPATILISLAISILGVALLQVVTLSSNSLNDQYYRSLAKEAAQAGITQSNACVTAGSTSWTSLQPGYSCSGTDLGQSPEFVAQKDNWRSTYTVTKSSNTIQSTGTVSLFTATGVTIRQFTHTLKTDLSTTIASIIAAPISNKVVSAVATGGDYTCALSEGAAYCWGLNTNGQLGIGNYSNKKAPFPVKASNPSDGLYGKTVTDIQVGADHTCAIVENNPTTATNQVWCWGLNTYGQLGTGNTATATEPVQVTGSGIENRRVTRINMGTNTPGAVTCALTDETTVSVAGTVPNAYCWGNNANGQLGNNTIGGQQNSPVRVTDPMNVIAGRPLKEIATGHVHTCGVTNDALGQLYCWGNNNTLGGSTGVFGIGVTTNFNRPYPQVPVPQASLGNQPATHVTAGSWNTCAIAGGKIYCWGNNGRGQLGIGNTTNTSSPNAAVADAVTAEPNANATDVDIDSDFTCAVIAGKAKCWGENTDDNNDGVTGQLGFGVAGSYGPSPLTVKPPVDGKTATTLAAGYQHGCGIADGSLFCWGKNNYGQLGTNDFTASNIPKSVSNSQLNMGNPNVATGITAGTDHSCAIIGGSAYCWGSNASGQLGNSDVVDQPEPTLVGGALAGKTVTHITAGDRFSCAATDTNQIYCWGRNTYGQLGNGTSGNTSNTPVAVIIPSGSGAISGLSAGTDHVCAIIYNTNVASPFLPVMCWGLNASRQLGDGTTTNRTSPTVATRVQNSTAAIKIGAGSTQSCYVRSTGSALFCWGTNTSSGLVGNNSSSSTGVNPTQINTGTIPNGCCSSNPIADVTTGTNFNCVIFSNTIRNHCWGLGTSNQLANSPTASSLVPVNSSNTGSIVGKNVSTTSAGANHACSVTTDNSLICWGMGANGRLGSGATTNSNPITINSSGSISGKTISGVAAGASHSCAIANGLLYCWGNYLNGRLGLGSSTVADVTTPTQITRYLTGPPSSSVTTPSRIAY